MVKTGLGIRILPVQIAAPYAPLLGLKAIPLSDDWARRQFAICHRERASMSRAAGLLLGPLVEGARTC